MRIRFFLIAGLVLFGCHHHGGGSSSGASSTVAAANVTGSWHGTVPLFGVNISTPVAGAPTLMVFTLTQSTTSVAGVDNVSGAWALPFQLGTVTGSVDTTTLTFNFNEPAPCTGLFSGTANVYVSSMTITYSGSDCHGSVSGISGTFFNSFI